MSSLIRGITNMLSPAGQQAPPDPDDHTSVVGTNNATGGSARGSPSYRSAEDEDDDEEETVYHQTVTSSPSNGRNAPRVSIVLPAEDDPPIMGVVKMSRTGTQNVYVGGKPLPDWSGLDPSAIPSITPNKYRGDSYKEAKSYNYRIKGFETKIAPKDDLRETCRNVLQHLVIHGLDTITYFRDPANPSVMQSVVEKPNMFSKAYVLTQIAIYLERWDHYDQENDECAIQFFMDSLNDELKRKVRDTLVNAPKLTFALVWMTFVEKIRVISVGRVDGLQKQVEKRLPTQYAGQNLETMAAANIRDINDLEQAGWYNLSTGNTMVRNFASANPECKSFTWFAQSYLARYEAAVTHCFHMNKNECKGYMEAHGFGYEEICTTFADYYRKAHQDGHWLPTKTARDSQGAPRNFANQAKLEQNKGKSTDKSQSTCHNCGETGHWVKNCPNPPTKSSNDSSNPKKKKGKGKGSAGSDRKGTPWTKVPPANGQPQTKTMHDKKFHWCDTCKRWTQSHGTADHKAKQITDTSAPTDTTPKSSDAPNNVSLMANTMDYAAWHVCIDHQREDFNAKENAWLNFISTFISIYIIQPIILLMWFVIGIGIATISFMSMLKLTDILGYGIIAPMLWVSTMLLFTILQPIYSYVPPDPPPPPLSRQKKRKMKWWLKKQLKRNVRKVKEKHQPNIDSFHRSYPLRLRSNGQYHTRRQLLTRKEEVLRQQKLFNHLMRMEVEMKELHQANEKLKGQVKYLVQQRNASRRYCPTPFEREKDTRREKEKKVRKELHKIRAKFDYIRKFVDDSPIHLSAYVAAYTPDKPSMTSTLLNMFIGYMSPLFQVQSNLSSAPTKPRTVIWDSGSSMCITNDRTEFIDGEFEALPPSQTVTGISSTKVKIHGVGVVRWSFIDTKGKIRTLDLPCLYIPSITQRLMSTTILLRQYPTESILLKNGSCALSGSRKTNGIDAYIDANNNLPTSQLCDPTISSHLSKQINSCISVVSEANQNLAEPEKELLKWHQRLAHIDMNKIKFLFRTGILARSEVSRSLQTAAAKLKTNPRCAACQFGKQCQTSVPTTKESKVTDAVGAISRDVVRPGQQVCVDHFICRNKGRLFTSRGKTDPSEMYGGGCIFVDNYSGFVHVELQKHMDAPETLKAKENFELMALDYGVIPQTYLSDNGSAFTSHEFTAKLKEFEQVSKLAGAGAHHHNGVAERNIRTIISIARTMMMHSAMHWPEVSDVELWPMAVKHAVYVFNRVPSIDTGICPLDKFTRQRFQQNKLHDLHVWGCPVYVLDKRLHDGKKIPRWAPRSGRSIYMGTSDKHSSTVPLVLNPETGAITPQFHVVVDEWFATIASSTGEVPDFTQEKWTKMFGENQYHYLWDEEWDVDDNLPVPQPESIDRRERRVSNAMENHLPPVPLPVMDPPTDQSPTTPFQTPVQNRFEPLSTYDDDDLQPMVIIDTSLPPIPQDDDIVPMDSPPQREHTEQRETPVTEDQTQVVSDGPSQVVEPIQNLPQATPSLRRSTRQRRAPDRLNLWTEQLNKCFLMDQTYGINPLNQDAFTYLYNALCETIPPVFQASSLVSSDAFKASLTDPDTLSWEQAMNDVEHVDEWMAAALKEITSLEEHGTWVLDDQANATSKILPGTWVFRVKRAPDGTIIKFKARYCVRGDLQVEQNETFAPVVSWSTIRLFLILSLLLHWKTKSIDFIQAFVQAMLKQPVWIHLPRGFHTSTGNKKCLKLVKSLYGLAEAPRLWYLHLFDALINKLGFTQSKIDPCLLMKDGIMIIVFVDDCAISYRSEADYNKLIADLRALSFDLTEEGEFSKFLGINFEYKENTVHMTQTGLIDRIAAATGLTDSKPNFTPAHHEALGKDLSGPPMIDTWSYRSIVGMLLYLSTNTRPDIAFAVSQVARFSNDPKQSHATAVKTIIRYLVGTRTKGTLVTPTGKLDMKMFVDADFAGLYKREAASDPDSARSRTGYILLLGGFPLIWKSQLQSKIALSTLEAEYSALSSSIRALIPIRELLFEISRTVALPKSLITTIRCTVFEDNQGAFLLASTQRLSTRTRYFTVEFHHFWEFVKLENENDRKILLEKIDTKDQGADFLTKGQFKLIYQYNRFLILGW